MTNLSSDVMMMVCFKLFKNAIGVIEGLVDLGLSTIHVAVKAIGGLLPVIRANNALIAVIESRGDKAYVVIEKIYSLALDSEPRAAIDPGSPTS